MLCLLKTSFFEIQNIGREALKLSWVMFNKVSWGVGVLMKFFGN